MRTKRKMKTRDDKKIKKKMTREATKGTQSERRTCLDFTQADDGQREPYLRGSYECTPVVTSKKGGLIIVGTCRRP